MSITLKAVFADSLLVPLLNAHLKFVPRAAYQ